jgi:hypothetical protein
MQDSVFHFDLLSFDHLRLSNDAFPAVGHRGFEIVPLFQLKKAKGIEYGKRIKRAGQDGDRLSFFIKVRIPGLKLLPVEIHRNSSLSFAVLRFLVKNGMGHALIGKSLDTVPHLVEDINELVSPRSHGKVVALHTVNGFHRQDLQDAIGCRDKSPSHLEEEFLTRRKRDSLLPGFGRRRRKKKGNKSEKYYGKKVHEFITVRNDKKLTTKTRKDESTKKFVSHGVTEKTEIY